MTDVAEVETFEAWWAGFLRGETSHDSNCGFWCRWDCFLRGEDHPE